MTTAAAAARAGERFWDRPARQRQQRQRQGRRCRCRHRRRRRPAPHKHSLDPQRRDQEEQRPALPGRPREGEQEDAASARGGPRAPPRSRPGGGPRRPTSACTPPASAPSPQRVWIALEAKALPYQYCEVDPFKKPRQLLEANPARSRARHPRRRLGLRRERRDSGICMADPYLTGIAI